MYLKYPIMETPVAVQECFNIEEEYINTLHTRSNARFLSSAKQQSGREMEALFDPQQDVIPEELQKFMHRRTSSEVELAMAGYFDAIVEASEICRQLLTNIKNTQSNYHSMESFLASISDSVDDATATAATATATTTPLPALKPFAVRSNPFSAATRSNFKRIHDRYSSVLHAIKSSHGKVARKLKVVRAVKKLSRTCLVVACGAAAGVAIGVAAHLLFFSLLLGPAAMALCPVALKRRVKRRQSRTRSLQQLQEQLDTAAKGTYVLGRDLDTVSHLVARLSDGIERENAMARCCVERVEGSFPVQEMVTELRRSCSCSRKLAEELEEHVCLCLATIHRARVLVITEISKQA
ncbi:hypothetical protein GUJ93_ZPchr0014g46614 [Zizania palustris]|uniref:Uncharacterized protein n=1 Tax=Zizania palustris TaxID=103762 RepID=A0A8J5TH53_ZIZPA|nr:hypothetical protein GUJ93_ZPchr0014g46614 [Zizania palustris]